MARRHAADGLGVRLFGKRQERYKAAWEYLWKCTGHAARYNLMLADTDTRDWDRF